MSFLSALEDTCSQSWPAVLVSLSPAVSGLLSATALWVASRAHSTSRDAQQTSQAAVSLSLLDSDSQRDSAQLGRHEAPPKPSSTTQAADDTST